MKRLLAAAHCRESTLALEAHGAQLVISRRDAEGMLTKLRLDADELDALLEVLALAQPALERRASE